MIGAQIAFMLNFTKELSTAGELVDAQGLSGPEHARVVRAGADGMPITDGVFPEAKEFLAGFWIVDVASEARAEALAARISAAPGRGASPSTCPSTSGR